MSLPFALAVSILFRRSGLTFIEALVFTLFVSAQSLLAQAAVVVPALLLGGSVSLLMWTTTVAALAVLFQASVGFFGRRVLAVLKVAMAMVVTFTLVAGGVSTLLIVYVRMFR
jgi:hypothetical protein